MSSPSLADLNRAFAIADQVRIVERDGYTTVLVHAQGADAEIALYGAQVLSWRPAGQHDVLWCAPLPKAGTGKAIRGGIPLCWPWFGPHATDTSQPQHGLVRTAEWSLAATLATDNGVTVALKHISSGCRLRLEVSVGQRLHVSLTTHNDRSEPMALTEALHTYFRVGEFGHISIYDLDGCTYRDNTDSGAQKVQRGPLIIDRETIALFDRAPDNCLLEDPILGRRIYIARSGGQSTIVWHPGASVATFKDIPPGTDRHFICIESGNIGAAAVTIPPGGTHRLSVDYSLLPS